MFRIAEKQDLPAITDLWGQVFGDSPEAVAAFFDAFPHCLSYVAEEKGRLTAMAHALPQTLSPNIPAAYLYAIGTAKAARGQGLCRNLMDFAQQDLRGRGFACCVLTPAEPSLFGFYKNLGYETAFYRKHTPFTDGKPISLQEYVRRRETLLSVPHMVCDENLLRYAAGLYGLTFYETPTGIAAAGKNFTAECLPEDLGGEPFAMVKWLSVPSTTGPAYLGFSLE